MNQETSPMLSIEHDLLEMASRAEMMFQRAVQALTYLQSHAAEQVIESDDRVDALDAKIELACLELLADREQVDVDRRKVGTVLKMITDIERVADLAVDLARCSLRVESELGESGFVDLPRFSDIARTMFHTAIESYAKQDVALISQVVRMEQQADKLFLELRDQAHQSMQSHPEHAVTLSYLVVAIHDIERVADHSINIAERVEFLLTGEMKSY